MIKRILLFLVILFHLHNIYSQSKDLTKVTFEIDKGDFKTALPFDEKFKVVFESSTEIEAIRIQYRVKNTVKNDINCLNNGGEELDEKKHYFQYQRANDCGYIVIPLKTVKSKVFSISDIGPLHPNTPYEFEFEIFTDGTLSEDDTKVLKEELLYEVKRLYLVKSLPGPNDIKTGITNVINKNTSELYEKDGNQTKIKNIIITDLPNIISNLQTNYADFGHVINNYDQNIRNVKNVFSISFTSDILSIVEKIDDKTIKYKELLTTPINGLLPNYGKVTLQDMLAFFKANCKRNNKYLFSILDGQSKYNGLIPEILPDNKRYHTESLQLLAATFSILLDLEDSNGKLFFAKRKNDLKNIISELSAPDDLTNLIMLSKKINYLRDQMQGESNTIPDIITNRYFKKDLITSYETTIDVESEAIPYINLDLGLLYATELNDFFALQIVNFHRKPVNRKSHFSDLKKWDKFWKQMSLQIGIAQKLGSDNDDYRGMLGDAGTPYFGAGFRINRYLRVGTGLLIYELENTNPIISEKITKGSPSFTISINSSLSGALGFIGDLLNIVK
ncbi:hypothetical protein GCM10009430_24420 [Aquimarina litoralis]|uniref:Uncharacterized protein n=1 Tax=Aquimarina litoralis TaxID=584605 RepID=A0ABP3U0Z1_9FLAO